MARIRVAETMEQQKPVKEAQRRQLWTRLVRRHTKFVVIFTVMAVLLVMAYIVSLLRDRNQLKQQVSDLTSTSSSTDEPSSLRDEVGRLYELPTDEIPTVATVTSKVLEQVKGQVFFKYAQDGDKVLVFPEAGKAILYRPSSKKIVELGPFNQSTSTDDRTNLAN